MVTVGMEQVLTAMAASVLHSASGMSRWGLADLTVGLYKLSGRHALEGAVDTITGVPVAYQSELDDMLEWLRWAKVAYKRSYKAFASKMEIQEEDIVTLVSTSAVMQPAYYIVVHHKRHCVVMGIRGTNTANDVLTDLNPHSEPFEGGYAHSGMLAAAQWLLQNEGQTLRDVLQAHPGFGLVLAGHSLGAGTAALLSLMLRETEPTPVGPLSRVLNIPVAMVICWGFGCPPCLDLNIAMTSSFIYNVVLQDDVVARASPAALEDLRSEIAQTEWCRKEHPECLTPIVLYINQSCGNVVEMCNVMYVLSVAKYIQDVVSLYNASSTCVLVEVSRSQAFKDGSAQRQVVEMLQTTAMRISQVEVSPETRAAFNKAKDTGYSTLVSAGSAVVSIFTGIKTSQAAQKKAGAWLAFGATAAKAGLLAASNRVAQGVNKSLSAIEAKTQKSDEGVAATALAVNAAAGTSNSSQFLIKRRLYVPGNLYHIIRLPVQLGQIQPNQEVSDPRRVQHTVIKGTDPNIRFGRIVLSGSMLSDHSCPAYVEAIEDTLQYASMGKTLHQ